MRRTFRTAGPLAVLALVAALTFAPAGAQEPPAVGEESFLNLEHVYNYKPSRQASYTYHGTDLAFWTADIPLRDPLTGEKVLDELGNEILVTRDFAVMGSTPDGGYIFDITDPENVTEVGLVECTQARNDPSVVQVDGRTLLILADEEGGALPCLRSLRRIGSATGSGVSVFDVTDPYEPVPLYSIEAGGGAHTATAHTTKPFVWMSTGDLPGGALGGGNQGLGKNSIPIVDFTDPDNPTLKTIDVNLGGPHNVEFSADGSRAYVANENHHEIWDATDPGNPTLISESTVNVGTYAHGLWGDADNEVMITNNESLALGGFFASGTGVCPGEGLGFYDVAGDNAANPIPTGYFVPQVPGVTPDERACTSHFGNIGASDDIITVGWYILGARVVDFSNPSLPTEVAHATMADSEAWTAKTYEGPYLYVGDIVRGFDVFRWTGQGAAPWEDPEDAWTPGQE